MTQSWQPIEQQLMQQALAAAQQALAQGEVPIGAVIADRYGQLLSQAHNLTETRHSQLAHAECLAIELATRQLGDWRLTGYTLYVTLEPCAMCMNLILLSRLDRVVFATASPVFGYNLDKYNSFELYNCPVIVQAGLCAVEARLLLQSFFSSKRTKA